MPRVNVACAQLNPTRGDVAGNMRRVDAMTSRLTADDGVDVLLLPEMALTGYVFDDARDARRVAEVRSISHWSPYDRVGVVNADP